jgi:PAS domain S-box-containing protein
VCVIATDITAQYHVAKSIVEDERRFRDILDSVDHIAIQGYDEDRRVIFWNPFSERLYGYTREEALGRRLEDLIIPDPMRDEVVSHVQLWIEDKIPIQSAELVLRDKHGGDVEVYSSHLMHETADGRREMYCVDVDLTDVKRMERELTAARDAAESASRAKSAFLANMSHEIRTPLNGIMGMLQLMNTDQVTGDQARCLEIALTSCKNLTRLLADILDLSRVEANRMVIVAEEFSIDAVLDHLLPTYGGDARSKGVELAIAVEPSLPETYIGDPVRLRQVFMNLVGNAVKFTPEGRVDVHIAGLPGADSDSWTLIGSVVDTGIGIPENQLDAIFEPFSQIECAYTRTHQGAGLGLSIVKRLVDLMGGTLTIESAPGEGTAVHVSVPVRIAQPTPDAALQKAAAPPMSLSVLLVEDDTVNRLTLRKLLERDGYTVVEARGGRQALELLAREPVDLVLMDIQLPDIDGLEATRRIRSGNVPGIDPNSPVIALTAYAMAGDREQFLEARMDDYLAKPVDMADLRDAIERLAGRAS